MDVSAQRVLPAKPSDVAAYAMDWRHDHEWTQSITNAELTTEAAYGGFGVGAEITRTAYFLRKRIDYVLRVDEHEPPHLLDMKSVRGPFPMHVTYRFDDHPDGTLAQIRVRGNASGFYRIAGPLLGPMVRANLRKDLRNLEGALT
ncbi:SRPBCC family protein [Haloechinothrix halophila]|uniref:SRPBCC family protein n=1 Tax=Haloechinothrix halophila TaxID=1069073 RepID=UPI000424D7D5|nr:SRPBCC family protein [Haloechinothrix halophila]